MTDLTDAALKLARLGNPVFPCHPDKKPMTPNGFKDATTDEARIRGWDWSGMIGATLPPGVIVVDVDPRNGGDDTMEALAQDGCALPETRLVRTGGRGWHHYLGVPEGLDLRGKLGAGVDIKKPGKGYVIVPPSPGYTYAFDAPIADAPQWLLDALVVEYTADPGEASDPKFFSHEDGTAYGLAALEREVGGLATAPEGGRNDALNRAAFSLAQLVAGGELDHARVFDDLKTVAGRIGLEDTEAMNTIMSGFEAGMGEPRQAPEVGADEATPDATGDESRMWLDWSVEEDEPPFILHPVLPANAYVLVYGATEAAKSMTWVGLLSQASHRGYRSSIYSLENPAQTDRSRLRRWAPDPSNLRITNNPLDLNDQRQMRALIDREKEWRTDIILIDTYSHAFRSRSDDGNAKAIEFARRVRHVMAEVGCSVIVVDHTGFSGDEPRDASAKRQQVDVAILMTKVGEWAANTPAGFTMTNRKSARFANPFRLSGEIRDTYTDDVRGLDLAWTSSGPPRWEER